MYNDVSFEYWKRYKKMTKKLIKKHLQEYIVESHFKQTDFTKKDSYYLLKIK